MAPNEICDEPLQGQNVLTTSVPRYLFRVDSPGSDGLNDEIGFFCQAYIHDVEIIETLEDLEWEDARLMVKDHVLWHSWRHREDDILISFTPSFLFAVQHCIRKIAKCRKTTRENCFITIIDTRQYPKETFHWTVYLLLKYDLSEIDDKNLAHRYHEGEYLAEHKVFTYHPEAACRVSFARLDSILYGIAADLNDPTHKDQLVVALNTFRWNWYAQEQVISDADISQAYALARQFGGKWFLPMAMWALALKCRQTDNVNRKADGIIGREGLSLPYLFGDQSEIPSTLRELKEWRKLMDALDSANLRTSAAEKETAHVIDDDLSKFMYAMQIS